MTRAVTKIRKDSGFGYQIEISFIQEENDHGVMTYECRIIEIWDDGHFTFPRRSYQKYHDKEQGNNEYKWYLRNGYKFHSKETFEPSKTDNR